MKSSEVINILVSNLGPDDICLSTTGYISRRLFAARDRETNFYMLGSMGLVSSVGLGIALNTDRRVVVLDGDGSLLMDMGTMAMIAGEAPRNLVHIVLDNGAYESTGGQPAVSRKVNLGRVAQAAGYRCIWRISSCRQLRRILEKIFNSSGPSFVHIRVSSEGIAGVSRIAVPPQKIAKRLRENLIRSREL